MLQPKARRVDQTQFQVATAKVRDYLSLHLLPKSNNLLQLSQIPNKTKTTICIQISAYYLQEYK